MLTLTHNKAFRTVFGSSFTRAYVLLVELALVLVSASLLSPEERGIYVAGIGLIKTMAVLSTLSLGQIAIHRVAAAGENRARELGIQVGNLIAGGLALTVAAIAVFYVTGMVSPRFNATYVAPFQFLVLVGLPIYLFELYLYTVLTVSDELSSANLSILVGKTVCWLVPVVSVWFMHRISMPVLVAYVVLGQFLVVAGYCLIIRRMQRSGTLVIRFEPSALVSAGKSAVRLYPTIIGSVVFGGIDLLLIYNYTSATETSTYQIALQGIGALSVLPFAVAQFGYATVARHGRTDGWRRYRKVLYLGLGVHVIFAAMSLVVVEFAEVLLVRHGYPDLGGIYFLLALGAPGVYLSLTMAPMWIGSGFFLMSSTLSIATAAVVIPLTSALVQAHGINGGGYAFLLAQALSLLTNGLLIYYCEKNGKQ